MEHGQNNADKEEKTEVPGGKPRPILSVFTKNSK